MSDSNKTEKPTHKRLEEARKKGNFLFSEVVVQVSVTLAGTAMCYWALMDLPQRFDRALQAAIALGQSAYFAAAVDNFLILLAKEVLPPSAMVFGAVALFSIVANISQVGFVFQGAKFTKGLQAINPVTNAKNLFSKQSLTNLFMSMVKVLIICSISYHYITDNQSLVEQIYSHRQDAIGGLTDMGQIIWKMVMTFLIALVPLAAVDWGLKYLFYQKDNMMGKDEVQREHKESEGDPAVKSQRKQIGREMLEAPVDRLKGASAVIRNPTHIAVVVRYEPNVAPVPYITDMQEGYAAKSIIRRATELGIPLYEDIPLARGIYAVGEIDHHIPLELSEKVVPFIYWLTSNHPDRVFEQGEFAEILTRIGDVKR